MKAPKGMEVGVVKGSSTSIEATSTSGDASIRVALFLFVFSLVYSASMQQMSVEDVGVT